MKQRYRMAVDMVGSSGNVYYQIQRKGWFGWSKFNIGVLSKEEALDALKALNEPETVARLNRIACSEWDHLL